MPSTSEPVLSRWIADREYSARTCRIGGGAKPRSARCCWSAA